MTNEMNVLVVHNLLIVSAVAQKLMITTELISQNKSMTIAWANSHFIFQKGDCLVWSAIVTYPLSSIQD
jgi:hypothetical protein